MVELASTFNEKVLLAIIGGTGLYKLEALKPIAELNISTPWGMPSSSITIARTRTGFPIAFLARHGPDHHLMPSDVPFRANIAALKKLGVKVILAFSAVGSLQEHIRPRDFIVPNQVIDRTKGIRPSTFFCKGFVAHVGFGEPFDTKLNKIIGDHCSEILHNRGARLHTKETEGKDVTLVCMEGPAFSTRAESQLYKSWGGSAINMSCIPESKLAREAEIAYQMICMATDYDAWNERKEPVTVKEVIGNLNANTANAHRVATKLIEILEPMIKNGEIGNDLIGVMQHTISTSPPGRSKEAVKRLSYLFPGYWPID